MGFFSKLFGRRDYDEELKEQSNKMNDTLQNVVVPPNASTFSFEIEDVFTITGRGTVVTGKCTSGVANIGDKVLIDGKIETTITGIESFRKQLNVVQAGDSVGILLSGVSRDVVNRASFLLK